MKTPSPRKVVTDFAKADKKSDKALLNKVLKKDAPSAALDRKADRVVARISTPKKPR